jgi:hypothetical protein
MANDWDIEARNSMLDHVGTEITRVALHTGDPGAANSATNEVAGGTYARQAITFAGAGSGTMASSNQPAFAVGAGITVAWVSFWNTAGTVRYAKKQVTAEAFGAAGTYTLTDADLDLNAA